MNYSKAKNDVAWVKAMKVEITALEKNHTWEITDLPKGKKAYRLQMGVQAQAQGSWDH